MTIRKVAIALITYRRTTYALRTVESFVDNVKLDRGQFVWYVADDGSDNDNYKQIVKKLKALGQTIFDGHHDRSGPGISQNRAANACFDASDQVFWLEDDWVAPEPVDLTPYYDILNYHQDVGMIRLGYISTGLECKVRGFDGRFYLEMMKTAQYAFSGHPALRHARWWKTYGPYDPNKSAGDCEIALDWRFRELDGPSILWPFSQTGYGPFHHIGTEKA